MWRDSGCSDRDLFIRELELVVEDDDERVVLLVSCGRSSELILFIPLAPSPLPRWTGLHSIPRRSKPASR